MALDYFFLRFLYFTSPFQTRRAARSVRLFYIPRPSVVSTAVNTISHAPSIWENQAREQAICKSLTRRIAHGYCSSPQYFSLASACALTHDDFTPLCSMSQVPRSRAPAHFLLEARVPYFTLAFRRCAFDSLFSSGFSPSSHGK